MGTVGRFGVGGQKVRPLPRGRLSLNQKAAKWHYVKDYSSQETAGNYFVPSFSILRHIHRNEEDYWLNVGYGISRVLGKKYQIHLPDDIVIKSIEQKALIHKIKESGERPTPEEMENVVYNIRDDLVSQLDKAPSPLEIGLGKLAVFGQNYNKLGFTIGGWRGWRAHYAEYDDCGEITSIGALLRENRAAMGNISTAFPEMQFSTSELSANPHITIASKKRGEIEDYELRNVQSRIDSLEIDDTALFGDPVISYKLAPDAPSRILGVGHYWESIVDVGCD